MLRLVHHTSQPVCKLPEEDKANLVEQTSAKNNPCFVQKKAKLLLGRRFRGPIAPCAPNERVGPLLPILCLSFPLFNQCRVVGVRQALFVDGGEGGEEEVGIASHILSLHVLTHRSFQESRVWAFEIPIIYQITKLTHVLKAATNIRPARR